MSPGKTQKGGGVGGQGLLKFLFRSILSTERPFLCWGPVLESRPRVGTHLLKGPESKEFSALQATPVSAVIIWLRCYGTEVATDITQINKCRHVPIKFYFQKQAEDWIWLVRYSSWAPGIDAHNSCSPSRHLPCCAHELSPWWSLLFPLLPYQTPSLSWSVFCWRLTFLKLSRQSACLLYFYQLSIVTLFFSLMGVCTFGLPSPTPAPIPHYSPLIIPLHHYLTCFGLGWFLTPVCV